MKAYDRLPRFLRGDVRRLMSEVPVFLRRGVQGRGRGMSVLTVTYLDHLQKSNADDLAFYPLSTLEKALQAGHVLHCEENGETAGYLWFGAVRPGFDTIVYQACIDYEARRRHLGWAMVRDLIAIAKAGGATGIRLKCASSAESNAFWLAIGFECVAVKNGGIKRGRDLNCYRTDLTPVLFTLPTVRPSEKPIDLRDYHLAKRIGTAMPSPFSRTHY